MNVKRILKLAEHLEKVPRRAFEQSKWCTTEPITPTTIKRNFECGTAACVAGHAAGVFPRLIGWKNVVDYGGGRSQPFLRSDPSKSDPLGVVLDICNKCEENLKVYNAPHQTPKAAARTLRRMVAGKSWKIVLDYNGAVTRTSRPRYCRHGANDCALQDS